MWTEISDYKLTGKEVRQKQEPIIDKTEQDRTTYSAYMYRKGQHIVRLKIIIQYCICVPEALRILRYLGYTGTV